ncbi:MAG: DUF1643 domain-containing protein [Sarcina sp.]
MQKNRYGKSFKDNSIEKIVDPDGGRVFKVTIPIDNGGENTIVVIGKAPKPSSEERGNDIRRAIKYLLSNKEVFGSIKQIDFVFLFPVIEYTKDALEETLYRSGELFLAGNEGIWNDDEFIKNDLVIFEEMIDYNHIIFAWGQPSKSLRTIYENRIQYLLKGFKLIKNNANEIKKTYVVGGLTNNGYPRQYTSWNKELHLVEYNI